MWLWLVTDLYHPLLRCIKVKTRRGVGERPQAMLQLLTVAIIHGRVMGRQSRG
jgi:hypothetical protein